MKKFLIKNISDLKNFFKDKNLTNTYFCNFVSCHENNGFVTLYSLFLRDTKRIDYQAFCLILIVNF